MSFDHDDDDEDDDDYDDYCGDDDDCDCDDDDDEVVVDDDVRCGRRRRRRRRPTKVRYFSRCNSLLDKDIAVGPWRVPNKCSQWPMANTTSIYSLQKIIKGDYILVS